MPLLTFIVGDWSRDGHGWTDAFAVDSSLDEQEVEDAYRRGVERSGLDLRKVARDYEDSFISDELLALVEAHGFTGHLEDGSEEHEDEWWEGDGGFNMNPEAYLRLYLFLIALGRPDAVLKRLHPPTVNVGGYGLYSP